MVHQQFSGRIKTDLSLLNRLLDVKLNSEEFINNQEAIETIGKVVDLLKNKKKGYILFSVTYKKDTAIILVLNNFSDDRIYTNGYYLSKWSKKEEIDKGFEAKIHESNFKRNLYKEIDSTQGISFRSAITLCVSESFNGYCVNTSRLKTIETFMNEDINKDEGMISRDSIEIRNMDLIEMLDSSVVKKSEYKQGHIDTVQQYINKLNNDKFITNIDRYTNDIITIGKIDEALQLLDNERVYTISTLTSSNGITSSLYRKRFKLSANALGESIYVRNLGNNTFTSEGTFLRYREVNDLAYILRTVRIEDIPINLVDKGRYFAVLDDKVNQVLLIGPDPRTHGNHREIFEAELHKQLQMIAEKNISFAGTYISDGTNRLQLFDYFDTNITNHKQKLLKAIKTMNEEYQFLAKKVLAKGEDVLITDNLKYNHSNGKVTYNDFSIEFNDELMKSALYKLFSNYLLRFYRGEVTEQKILDSVLASIFFVLEKRLFARIKEDFLRDLIINDVIKLKLEHKISKSGSRLIYLNGRKFNANEILRIIREITCYRSNEEASRFIENVGKIGLSVYIGITSGYEVVFKNESRENYKRLFRFKKLAGRSNYELLLDTVSIKINSKALISLLYKNFIGEYISDFQNKINKAIFENCDSSIDYMKYKFLIDSCYEKYKENAKKFLEKKVENTESEFVSYYEEKENKLLEAIKVTGLSGNTYVIAYNDVDSFVFLSPTLMKNKENVYEKGRYICMIDESNIKSNIGYDTIVSKLLSLKNDSSVAHTIYNLEEELNG